MTLWSLQVSAFRILTVSSFGTLRTHGRISFVWLERLCRETWWQSPMKGRDAKLMKKESWLVISVSQSCKNDLSTVCSKTTNLLLHSSGAQRSEIKFSVGLVSSGGLEGKICSCLSPRLWRLSAVLGIPWLLCGLFQYLLLSLYSVLSWVCLFCVFVSLSPFSFKDTSFGIWGSS